MTNRLNIIAKIILLFVVLFIVAATKAVGQKSLDSLDFTYFKGYQPTVADAFKLNDQPLFRDSTQRIQQSNFSISSKKVNTMFIPEPIKPAKMVGEPLTKLYRSLIKVGGGNYSTPYAEYFYNSLRSKNSIYGMRLKHISSQATLADVGYSGYSDNEAAIYAKKFFKAHSLSGNLEYTRNGLHQYGYNDDLFSLQTSTIRQVYTHVEPTIRVKTYHKDSSKVNYDAGMKYYYHADRLGAKESNFKADAILKTYYQSQLITAGAYIDYYYNVTNTDTTNNIICKINPFSIAASGEKWTGNLGVNIFMDVNDAATVFKFYPNIDFHYHIIDNIFIPYAGVTGGLERNSFYGYFLQNPFIISNINLSKNTDNTFTAFGGIRGTFSSKLYYNAKAAFSLVKGMPFFVNDLSNIVENTFNVVYDTVTVFTVSGEMGYQQTEKLRIGVKANYNKYSLDNQLFAWHKPTWELALTGNYNLSDKIITKMDVFYIGKRYARAYETLPDFTKVFKGEELKAYVDVNLGLEYRYTKKLGAFLNINNIAATRYYRWKGYPNQRLNVLAGVSYSF